MAVLIFVGIAAVMLVFFVVSWQMDKKRKEGLAAAAAARGWTFSDQRDDNVADFFGFLDRIKDGGRRYATDVIRGHWQNWPIMAFNYHTQTSSYRDGKRQTHSHWHAVIAFQLPTSHGYPELTVAPEGFFSRMVDSFTNRDIDFAHAPEFSRAYRVHSDNAQMAHDICNPSMIDYLMQSSGSNFEIEGQWLATVEQGKLNATDFERRLGQLTDIAMRLPPHMQSD